MVQAGQLVMFDSYVFVYGNNKTCVFFWLLGKFYETVCEACHITLNKIAIFGDNGTIIPGGVRIGKR
jgi:hypothetical protein